VFLEPWNQYPADAGFDFIHHVRIFQSILIFVDSIAIPSIKITMD